MTAIVIIASIVGLIWGTWLCIRGSLLGGCVVYLIAACCFGPYFFQFQAGINLTLDRLFLVALTGAFVVQWRLGRTDSKPLARIDYVLLTFIGALVVSLFSHDWRSTDVPVVQHLLNGYLIPLTLYWIARQAMLTERNVSMVLVMLAGFGVYLAFTGLCEVAQMWALVFPRYIADPEIGRHFGRARGPMVQSVSYGLYTGICFLAVWLWRDRVTNRWRWAILALLPLFLAAIFFTKTRTVWIGAASGFLLVLALTLRGQIRWVVIGSILSVGLLGVTLNLDEIMSVKREGSAADSRQSVGMRECFAYVSWQMFKDRPLWGFGFGQFARKKLPYLSDSRVDLPLEQIRNWEHHNTFLSILTETGLIGFTLFMAIYIGWGWTAWQLIRDERAPPWAKRHGILMLGVLAVAFWQMLGHEITFTPLDQSLLFILAGITVGLRLQTHKVIETK